MSKAIPVGHYSQLGEQTIQKMSENKDEYSKFLKYFGRVYKHPVSVALEFFVNRPDAQFIATENQWGKAGFPIAMGREGIKFLDSKGNTAILYDFSDVVGEFPPKRWTITKNNVDAVRELLQLLKDKQLFAALDESTASVMEDVSLIQELGLNSLSNEEKVQFRNSYHNMIQIMISGRLETNGASYSINPDKGVSRKCRMIDDYYEHIKKDKRKELFYETIVQFGNVEDSPCGSERGEVAKQMLDEYMKEFQKRNPNLYVFNAVMHLDEASPHLHIDFIPFYTNNRIKGLKKGVSMKSALDEQGFKAKGRNLNQLVVWEETERNAMEKILKDRNLYRENKNSSRVHLSVEEYKDIVNNGSFKEVLKKKYFVSDEEVTKEKLRGLKTKVSIMETENAKLKKDKNSPMKSFFYSDSDKQSFVMQKLDAENIPFVETEHGFDAQECYVEQIRKWEKDYKSPKNNRDVLRDDIDKYLMQSDNIHQLYVKLKAVGYEIKSGRYVSIKPPNAERFIRLKSLGEEYNEVALERRIKYNLKFVKELNNRIETAKSVNFMSERTLKTISMYMFHFRENKLPVRKKDKSKPLTWTNDEEVDRLLLLNKYINGGRTLEDMKEKFREAEQRLADKNNEISEIRDKFNNRIKIVEGFAVYFGYKESKTISKELAEQYHKKFPNINEDNYDDVIKLRDESEEKMKQAQKEYKEIEKEIRGL